MGDRIVEHCPKCGELDYPPGCACVLADPTPAPPRRQKLITSDGPSELLVAWWALVGIVLSLAFGVYGYVVREGHGPGYFVERAIGVAFLYLVGTVVALILGWAVRTVWRGR